MNKKQELKMLGETIDEHYNRGFQEGKTQALKDILYLIENIHNYFDTLRGGMINRVNMLSYEDKLIYEIKSQLSKDKKVGEE